MAVLRTEKTQNFTIMSNHHLRNAALSLKAKGLLSQMLSLPDTWDYTLQGLSHINRESVAAIRTAILELENAGYILRHQKRDKSGKMSNTDYVIYEHPPELDKPPFSLPCDFPLTDNPISEKPTQLSKESKSITEKPSTESNPILPQPLLQNTQGKPPDKKGAEAAHVLNSEVGIRNSESEKHVGLVSSSAFRIPNSELVNNSAFRTPNWLIIPHSAFRTPNWLIIPHSAFRTPNWLIVPHSAFRTPNWR